MRYRTLDANDDYTFGVNGSNFLIDNPAAVAQAVKTRVGLVQGEWFLDNTAGMPYDTDILGAGTGSTRDLAIQSYILATEGVNEITEYASYLNPTTRQFTWAATIDTDYGTTTVTS